MSKRWQTLTSLYLVFIRLIIDGKKLSQVEVKLLLVDILIDEEDLPPTILFPQANIH